MNVLLHNGKKEQQSFAAALPWIWPMHDACRPQMVAKRTKHEEIIGAQKLPSRGLDSCMNDAMVAHRRKLTLPRFLAVN
jgi:hypothetical protein